MQLDPEEEGNNLHFAAERKYLEERRVYIHLLVGTQFGRHWNDIKASDRFCCICSDAIKLGKQRIFQLWLRVMGGLNRENKWEYAIAFAPCCQKCKSSRIRRFSLLIVQEERHFESIYSFIDNHAFQDKQVEVDNFLAGTRNARDAVFCALADNYLYRFTLINSQIPRALKVLFGSASCFYCKSKESVKACDACKSLCFCSACWKAKAKKHHKELCEALKRSRLLHCNTDMDPIYFIDRTPMGRCLRFSPEDV